MDGDAKLDGQALCLRASPRSDLDGNVESRTVNIAKTEKYLLSVNFTAD